MKVSEFDYELPDELIAQEPSPDRDASRLMVLRGDAIRHRRFAELPDETAPGDLLVLNDTKVLAARLFGRKPTGGEVELLLVERSGSSEGEPVWHALLGGAGSLAPGTRLAFPDGLTVVALSREEAAWRVRLSHPSGDPAAVIERHGIMPLPPYITRTRDDPRAAADRERYQTVYARVPGAVAAPTAGLHFTEALLDRLRARGVETAFLTLQVGLGTFLPMRGETVEEHVMHEEAYVVPPETAARVAAARARGGRVVAVGTTVARALETCADGSGGVRPGSGRSSLFVYPGYRFSVVDALVTNFHLPRSTLLLLVSAFAGTERIRAAYRDAVRQRYRFYSYGDAMLAERA